MTKQILRKKFMDLGNPRTLAKEARKSVKLCHKKGRYVATLCIIACVIDAFAGGKGKKEKQQNYLCILEKHFPALCKELGAKKFYSMYRHGIVHSFRPKEGYALCETDEVNHRYIGKVKIEHRPDTLIGLNMDRLAEDFVRFCGQAISGKVSSQISARV